MCYLCELREAQQPFFKGGLFVLPHDAKKHPHVLNQIDPIAIDYLSLVLNDTKFAPFIVKGDGNCLLHALCFGISGKDQHYIELRVLMASELQQNRNWYNSFFTMENIDSFIDSSNKDGEFLSFENIFALSNVLERPIILYASLEDMSIGGTGYGGTAATFLPTRIPASSVSAPPVVIAWSSVSKTHYVPMIPFLMANDKHPLDLSTLPEVAFPNSIPPGTHKFDYFRIKPVGDSTESVVELNYKGESIARGKVSLLAYSDPWVNALKSIHHFGVGKEKLSFLSQFFHEVAKANFVPSRMSDSSWNDYLKFIGNSTFPSRSHLAPPRTPIDKLAKGLETPDVRSKFTPDELVLLDTILAGLKDPSKPHLQPQPFFDLVTMILKYGQNAEVQPLVFLLGLLHSFCSLAPSEIVSTLLSFDKVARGPIQVLDIDVPSMAPNDRIHALVNILPNIAENNQILLLRSFSELLQSSFDPLTLSLIANPVITKCLCGLISSVKEVHYRTLSSYLCNYATLVTSSLLYSPTVHENAMSLLNLMMAKCHPNLPHEKSDEIQLNLQRLLLGIGNILVAKPEFAPIHSESIREVADHLPENAQALQEVSNDLLPLLTPSVSVSPNKPIERRWYGSRIQMETM